MEPEKGKPARTPARRAEIRQRIVFAASAGLLIIGAIVFVQTRTDEGPAPTADTRTGTTTQATPIREGPNLKLDGQVQRVASRFLLTALGRTNYGESWRLAAPELRSQVTRKQWFAGTMPFAPFPVRSASYQIVGESPSEVLLTVYVVPKPNTEYEDPIRYDMTLVKRKGNWLVSYLVPYAPPPIREEGE